MVSARIHAGNGTARKLRCRVENTDFRIVLVLHVIADIAKQHDKVGRASLQIRHRFVDIIHYIVCRRTVQVGQSPYIYFLLTVIANKFACLRA